MSRANFTHLGVTREDLVRDMIGWRRGGSSHTRGRAGRARTVAREGFTRSGDFEDVSFGVAAARCWDSPVCGGGTNRAGGSDLG